MSARSPALPNQDADVLAAQEDKGRRVATALLACGLKRYTIEKMAYGAVRWPRQERLASQFYRDCAKASLSFSEEYAFMAGVAAVLEGDE